MTSNIYRKARGELLKELVRSGVLGEHGRLWESNGK